MRVRQHGKLWDVYLQDDGTMDTVISVQPVAPKKRPRNQEPEYFPKIETRFTDTSEMRRRDGSLTLTGLRELALEAINDYSEDLQ